MENPKDIFKEFTKHDIINYLDIKDLLTDIKNNKKLMKMV
tara:strand:+ start:1204 stop:1323 length:120 start_codon:yes stop_codon:yes gene_type:complete